MQSPSIGLVVHDSGDALITWLILMESKRESNIINKGALPTYQLSQCHSASPHDTRRAMDHREDP